MEREYGGVVFTDFGPDLAEQQLDDLESLAHVRLPADYRQFLRTVNGGRPRPSGFRLHGDDDAIRNYLQQLRDELKALDSWRDLTEIQRLTETLQFYENVKVPSRVAQLFSVGTGAYDSLESVVANTEAAQLYVPFKLLPVGLDGDDNGICVCCEPQWFGHVFVLPLPTAPGELREAEELRDGFAAVSFESFVRGLFPARLIVRPGYTPPQRYLDSLGVPEKYSE
jgi:hypothetical protein